MGWGQNLYNAISADLGFIVLIAIMAVGVYFAVKREFTKLIGVAIVLVISVGFVFTPESVKDVMLRLFNKVIK